MQIIGESHPIKRLKEIIKQVSDTGLSVLITGESGVGKELVARSLHEHSPRKRNPFIKVNCAAMHENLLESELFGHEKGAFTGAEKQRQGHFERANGGTLFLDEIGDMALTTQAKILRVLQEGECNRLGGEKTIRVDVRLLAATHKNLEEMVAASSFRQDLFFRLNVVPVHLPPLRDRREDIPVLADHFLRKFAAKNRKNLRGLHPAAIRSLTEYDWPGNIRELENTMERAVILCLGEQITPAELPAHFPVVQGREADGMQNRPQGGSLKDMERELIRATLKEAGGNKTRTAKTLGITRQTLLNKIREYGL
jgi:two-component system response regulator HydG